MVNQGQFRTWRKLHLVVDATTAEILSSKLTTHCKRDSTPPKMESCNKAKNLYQSLRVGIDVQRFIRHVERCGVRKLQ